MSVSTTNLVLDEYRTTKGVFAGAYDLVCRRMCEANHMDGLDPYRDVDRIASTHGQRVADALDATTLPGYWSEAFPEIGRSAERAEAVLHGYRAIAVGCGIGVRPAPLDPPKLRSLLLSRTPGSQLVLAAWRRPALAFLWYVSASNGTGHYRTARSLWETESLWFDMGAAFAAVELIYSDQGTPVGDPDGWLFTIKECEVTARMVAKRPQKTKAKG